MERLLTMDNEQYITRMQAECRKIMEQIADAVNDAPTGNVISGSEMQGPGQRRIDDGVGGPVPEQRAMGSILG